MQQVDRHHRSFNYVIRCQACIHDCSGVCPYAVYRLIVDACTSSLGDSGRSGRESVCRNGCGGLAVLALVLATFPAFTRLWVVGGPIKTVIALPQSLFFLHTTATTTLARPGTIETTCIATSSGTVLLARCASFPLSLFRLQSEHSSPHRSYLRLCLQAPRHQQALNPFTTRSTSGTRPHCAPSTTLAPHNVYTCTEQSPTRTNDAHIHARLRQALGG